MDYGEFIGRKSFCPVQSGFDPDLSWYPALKDFQRDIVRWACNRGRAAIFAGTGLGKTLMQLVWADLVTDRAGQPVLILAPLAVSEQTIEEGQKFGIGVERLAGDVSGRGIYITNYEQLHKIDCRQFAGIVLDESSIIKGFDGRLRRQITDLFKNTPYKLSCTATPSPNDLMEFGTQSEFLGIMSHAEMLAMFFIHDGEDTSKWRLKGHGRAKFWEWLSTWSVVIRNPGDYGYDSTGYDLPTLHIHEHVVPSGILDGLLPWIAQSLSERNQARKSSVDARVAKVAELVNSIEGDVLIWCNLNAEADALARAIDGSIEVRGSDDPDYKVAAVKWFTHAGDFQWFLRTIKKSTTKKTESEGLQNQLSGQIKTKNIEKRTCESTGLKTLENGSEPQNNNQKSIDEEEKNTPLTRNTEKKKKQNQENTAKETQAQKQSSDCQNTASQLTTTTKSSANKTEGVQFAELNTQDAQSVKDCTSITATKQAELEDCFVQTATWESENSETNQNCLNQPQNTSRKVLISKPSMFGYGLNLQNCNHMIFTGLSDSFEQYYQAVRRCWRFGQKNEVHVHVVSADSEGAVVANIKRKEMQHEQIAKEMIACVKEFTAKQLGKAYQEKTIYKPQQTIQVPSWM